MKDIVIKVHGLSSVYAAGRDTALRKQALFDIHLEIERSSCAAIVGVTGSGKSTLVQHFNGLLLPTQGSVVVDGINVGAVGSDLRLLRQRVGMLFQFPEAQLFERTVFADVAFGPRRMHLSQLEVRARVLQALEQVGLSPRDYAQRSPFELSGGQQRRVALAGILAMRPAILILDEPGVGMDAKGRAEFYQCILALQRRGVTIVFISHDMAEVAALADRMFVLHQGHLVMQGTPGEIFAQSASLREYGLAPAPLISLLELLRQNGLNVPAEVTNVDEAFLFLKEKNQHF